MMNIAAPNAEKHQTAAVNIARYTICSGFITTKTRTIIGRP